MSLVEVTPLGDAVGLALNRPQKLNAITGELETEILAALASPELRNARCVVVEGRGRAFCAGYDINELNDVSPEGVREYFEGPGAMTERLAAHPVPTVAAIHGYCFGGGFELALACDFRVAEASATFAWPEAERGTLPTAGGVLRMARIVGPAKAKELILLRSRLTAAEALELGLLTEVVPDGGARDRALEIAARLASFTPLVNWACKQLVDRAAESSRETVILLERLAYGLMAQDEEAAQRAVAKLDGLK